MIAFDNAASEIGVHGGTTSWSYTVGATANYLFVMGGQNLTGGSYGGQALTLITNFVPSIMDGNQQIMNIYGLANPPTGINTLAVTVSSGNQAEVIIASYSGVNTDITMPEDGNTRFSNNGVNNTQVSTLATSVTPISDNAWVVLFAIGSDGTKTFTSPDGTVRVTNDISTSIGNAAIIDTNAPITPPASTTLTADWSSGAGFTSLVIYSLAPEEESVGNFFLVL